jgi:hypothetical protein
VIAGDDVDDGTLRPLLVLEQVIHGCAYLGVGLRWRRHDLRVARSERAYDVDTADDSDELAVRYHRHPLDVVLLHQSDDVIEWRILTYGEHFLAHDVVCVQRMRFAELACLLVGTCKE